MTTQQIEARQIEARQIEALQIVRQAYQYDYIRSETLIDIAHELGTYRAELYDSRDLPTLVLGWVGEFLDQYADQWKNGWPDRDYLSTMEKFVAKKVRVAQADGTIYRVQR